MVGQEQKTPFQLYYNSSQLPSAASRDAPFINLVSLQSAVEKQTEDNTPIL